MRPAIWLVWAYFAWQHNSGKPQTTAVGAMVTTYF